MSALLFSSFTLVSRLAVQTTFDVLDLAAVRMAVAGALMVPLALRYGMSGLGWRRSVVLALLGGLGFALFAYSGFARAPALHGGVFLHGALPLFGTIAGVLLLGERPGRARLTGIALIVAGVVAIGWDALGAGMSARVMIGDACLAGASLCWAFYAVVVRRWGLDPLHAAAIVAPLSALLYLPVYLAVAGDRILAVDTAALWTQAAFQGVLIGVVSLLCYTAAVRLLGATETALATAAVPCLTALGAIPVLGEWPSPVAAAGVAVTTLGMIVAFQPGGSGPRGRPGIPKREAS